MAKLFDVFLFMLEEHLLPHVLWWVKRDERSLRLRFFHFGRRNKNKTWSTVFKVLDSFNERKKEEYLKDKKYESNSKYRCRANIKKFKDNNELIENPDVTDDQNLGTVREFIVNPDYDISHGIGTLTEEEKNRVRRMVAEDQLAEERALPDPSPGTSCNEMAEDHKSWALAEKRFLPDPSPGTSCNKKFKSSSLTVDLPSNLTQELSTQPSPNSVQQNPSGSTNTIIIIINVVTTSEPPRECEMAEASTTDIIPVSHNYATNDVSMLSFNPNNESIYPLEEIRPLRSPASCVQNNISLCEPVEKDCDVDGQNQGLLDESCFWGNKEESINIEDFLKQENVDALIDSQQDPYLNEHIPESLDEEQGTQFIQGQDSSEPDPVPYTGWLEVFNQHVGDY